VTKTGSWMVTSVNGFPGSVLVFAEPPFHCSPKEVLFLRFPSLVVISAPDGARPKDIPIPLALSAIVS